VCFSLHVLVCNLLKCISAKKMVIYKDGCDTEPASGVHICFDIIEINHVSEGYSALCLNFRQMRALSLPLFTVLSCSVYLGTSRTYCQNVILVYRANLEEA
jgi:hypothetical protein